MNCMRCGIRIFYDWSYNDNRGYWSTEAGNRKCYSNSKQPHEPEYGQIVMV